MLVLTRKIHQSIYIGNDIMITITDVDRGKVRIAISAPKDVPIYREEILPASHPLYQPIIERDLD